ncbi:unnamed protein product, partial [Rhizoctonia solani]
LGATPLSFDSTVELRRHQPRLARSTSRLHHHHHPDCPARRPLTTDPTHLPEKAAVTLDSSLGSLPQWRPMHDVPSWGNKNNRRPRIGLRTHPTTVQRCSICRDRGAEKIARRGLLECTLTIARTDLAQTLGHTRMRVHD